MKTKQESLRVLKEREVDGTMNFQLRKKKKDEMIYKKSTEKERNRKKNKLKRI